MVLGADSDLRLTNHMAFMFVFRFHKPYISQALYFTSHLHLYLDFHTPDLDLDFMPSNLDLLIDLFAMQFAFEFMYFENAFEFVLSRKPDCICIVCQA